MTRAARSEAAEESLRRVPHKAGDAEIRVACAKVALIPFKAICQY